MIPHRDPGRPDSYLVEVPGEEPVAFLDQKGRIAAFNPAWQRQIENGLHGWGKGGDDYRARFTELLQEGLEKETIKQRLQAVLDGQRNQAAFQGNVVDHPEIRQLTIGQLPEKAAYRAVVIARLERGAPPEGELPLQEAAWARRLFAESPVGIAVVDAEGCPEKVNPALAEMLGYETRDLVGVPFPEFTHPEDANKDLDLYRKLCRREIFDYQLRKRFLRSDGSVLWGHLRVVAIPLPDSPHLCQVAFVQDLTETLEARKRYRQLFQESRDAVYLTNPAGEIIEVNPAARKLFGYDRQELQQLKASELYVNPGRRELFKQRMREQGYVEDFEFKLKTPEGVRYCRESATARVNPQGEITGYQGIIRDITEERELRRDLEARREKYEAILKDISDVVTILDYEGVIQYESPSIQHVFGYAPDELVGEYALDLIHPDDRPEVAEKLAQALDEEIDAGGARYRFRHADGSWRWVESTGRVSDHEDMGPIIVTRDITEQRRAEQKYQAMYRTNPAAVGLSTLDGVFVEVNRAFEKLFGYSAEEIVQSSIEELDLWVEPNHRKELVKRIKAEGRVENEEVQLRGKEGDIIDVLFSASVLDLRDTPHLLGVAHDIRERKAFEQELEYQALHDRLTDLPNRTLFRDRLEHALERRQRHGQEVAVLILDLDQFKAVNDGLGHVIGDQTLYRVAGRIRERVHQEDTIARVGGDEFGVLLEDIENASEIKQAAERLKQAFDIPFEVSDQQFSLEVSIGAASTHQGPEQPEELMRLADTAMYRSKQGPRQGFHLFNPKEDEQAARRLQRKEELRQALDNEEIIPYYQPIVELATEQIWGIEPLARWQHPEKGILAPEHFIPLAEEHELIHKLGTQVLRQACQQLEQWNQALPEQSNLRLSPNVSGQQFEQDSLEKTIQECLQKTSIKASQLFLEVTESVLMRSPAKLEEIRKLGVHLLVDDFGTGYSSFEYLRDLEIAGLKIDMGFVQQLRENPKNRAIVETMLTLADQMDFHITAEGIETREQRDLLVGMGCPLGQGYYFARPMDGEAMTEFLREHHT